MILLTGDTDEPQIIQLNVYLHVAGLQNKEGYLIFLNQLYSSVVHPCCSVNNRLLFLDRHGQGLQINETGTVLNNDQNVQEGDATGDHSSIAARPKKNFAFTKLLISQIINFGYGYCSD